MAVQAQYPANSLFLNSFRRSIQEGKNDYSLQNQSPNGGGGGRFLDQSQMIFNNGGGGGVGTNPRKRGRELSATPSPAVNHFSLQSQPSQLIDLTQLHTSPQPNVVSTGLRLAFGEQQHLQPHNQIHHHHHHHSLSPQSSSVALSLLPEDLATQISHQRDEIDQFLHAQGEQLRRTLAEKRQRHYRTLLGAAEESLVRKLREKEAETEKAARRNAELEARAAQLSAEAQVWQARARAHEVTAAALQAQLQQAIITGGGGGCSGIDRGGEETGWGTGGGEAEDAESSFVDPDRVVETSGPSCKACRKRVASVVLLPCRHLCLCTECGVLAQACPLCLGFKESWVEVLLP